MPTFLLTPYTESINGLFDCQVLFSIVLLILWLGLVVDNKTNKTLNYLVNAWKLFWVFSLLIKVSFYVVRIFVWGVIKQVNASGGYIGVSLAKL